MSVRVGIVPARCRTPTIKCGSHSMRSMVKCTGSANRLVGKVTAHAFNLMHYYLLVADKSPIHSSTQDQKSGAPLAPQTVVSLTR